MHALPRVPPSGPRPQSATCVLHSQKCPLWPACPPGQHSPLRGPGPCHAQPWRPQMDDVDRLSRGDGARHRGTGCRDVPHRLNAEERRVYEAAKKKGYLAVRGTGYRRERKGNPLPNTFRQWCDAKAMACVVIEQDWAGGEQDTVVVDLSTLRLREREVQRARDHLTELAGRLGVTELPAGVRPSEAVPFNILLTEHEPPRPAFKQARRKPKADTTSSVQGMQAVQEEVQRLTVGGPADQAARIAEAERRVAELQIKADAAAAEVRRLKEEVGWHNAAPVVREHVAIMKEHRAELERARTVLELAKTPYAARQAALFAAFGTHGPATLPQQDSCVHTATAEDHNSQSLSSDQTAVGAGVDHNTLQGNMQGVGLTAIVDEDSDEHPRMKNAIWALPAQPVFFTAARTEAKAFAKEACLALTCAELEKAVLTAGVA